MVTVLFAISFFSAKRAFFCTSPSSPSRERVVDSGCQKPYDVDVFRSGCKTARTHRRGCACLENHGRSDVYGSC